MTCRRASRRAVAMAVGNAGRPRRPRPLPVPLGNPEGAHTRRQE
ncbi:hypothetical protein chiPu_0029433, partial [Chiloscyllium punctatum]|nr:hypothetical protein [Chiloscyllium punctatum]